MGDFFLLGVLITTMDPKYQVTNRKVYRYTTAALLKETVCLGR